MSTMSSVDSDLRGGMASKMKKSILCIVFLMLALVRNSESGAEDRTSSPNNSDRYGGWKEIQGEANGYFHLQRINDRWWLITPEGNVFLSVGVNSVHPNGDFAPALGYSPYERNIGQKYANIHGWISATLGNLRDWGFNTVGGFSLPVYDRTTDDQAIPYTISLALGDLGGADWQKGTFPDVFNAAFRDEVAKAVSRICAKARQDPYLIGYFTDNELNWDNAIPSMLRLPDNAPGKRAVMKFIKDYYGNDFNKFKAVWETTAASFDALGDTKSIQPKKGSELKAKDARDALLRFITREYFEATAGAIRSCDKNHLILGVRFLPVTPRLVVEESGHYADVTAVNYYTNKDEDKSKNYLEWIEGQAAHGMAVAEHGWLKEYYELSRRPVLITEFSFKAKDSRLPNKRGGGLETRVYQTQQERADMYEWYAKRSASKEYIIGYHWFQYMDQPKEGRFDGENSNLGLVDIRDTAYPSLIERIRVVNRAIYLIHEGRN